MLQQLPDASDGDRLTVASFSKMVQIDAFLSPGFLTESQSHPFLFRRNGLACQSCEEEHPNCTSARMDVPLGHYASARGGGRFSEITLLDNALGAPPTILSAHRHHGNWSERYVPPSVNFKHQLVMGCMSYHAYFIKQ